MSRGVNRVILIGNLGADPELRHMPNGDAVASVSLATDESYKDKSSGQMVPKTEWHRLTFWRKPAEIVSQYCRKGSKLYIEGKLQTRDYEKDGVKRYVTEIVVSEMQMLDGRPDGRPDGGKPAFDAPQQSAPSPMQGGPMTDFNDDVPF